MAVEFKLDWDKAVAAVTYLASRNVPELTKGKLCKLVFLADKYHLVRYGRLITGDSYFAVENGPIPSVTLDKLNDVEQERGERLATLIALDRKFSYPRLSAKETYGIENLSDSDVMALNYVIEKFGKMNWLELRALTHELPAYKKAWEHRGDAKRVPMVFEDFFEEDEDAIAGTFEEMLESDALGKLLAVK
jgi:uncharacterized phage-associated protein